MLLLLLLVPLLGILTIYINMSYKLTYTSVNRIKLIALTTSIFNLYLSYLIFVLFDFSSNQFQFVQEHYIINSYDIYLGIDGLSIYFILLTTLITPIALLSN